MLGNAPRLTSGAHAAGDPRIIWGGHCKEIVKPQRPDRAAIKFTRKVSQVADPAHAEQEVTFMKSLRGSPARHAKPTEEVTSGLPLERTLVRLVEQLAHSSTRFTCTAIHTPPRAAGMPHWFSDPAPSHSG